MKKLFVLSLIICSVCMLQAQKVKGDLSVLKGQSKVNVVFVYDGVTYDGDSEEEFFKDHKDHDNFEQWKANWTGRFREDKWEAKFLDELNDEMEDLKIDFGVYPSASYTMEVKMVDIDPGGFSGPFSVPSKLTGDIRFLKTGSSESFASISFTKIQGNPYKLTPVFEDRVRYAFEELGETIGEIMKKKVK